MISGYSKKGLPRVIHISIARFQRQLPEEHEPLSFLVSIHEEGTGISWQQNVVVGLDEEQALVEAVDDLYLWSLNRALTPEKAYELLDFVGQELFKLFIGSEGWAVLENLEPTAVLMNVDETILNLPWELIRWPKGPVVFEEPFGRLVTTRLLLRPGRDPEDEDDVVRILAVTNPTSDLGITQSTIKALTDLEDHFGGLPIEVTVLNEAQGTLARFRQEVQDKEYDIIHFAGHAYLEQDQPGSSALRFADGDLTANAVLDLPWKKPPYFVFNSACESARAVRALRLVSEEKQGNGLAAAFLASGVYGYAGFFWPVTDVGAGIFTRTFYRAMFERENVGIGFLEARRTVVNEVPRAVGDLTGFSAVLYGDAASKHRRDLYQAA